MEPTVERLKQDQRMYSWLRKIYPTLTDADKEEARQIFPDVLESEDERIRGAILIYLDWLDGRKDCQPKGDYTIRDMFAYLEKQKEQRPTKWSNADEQNLELIIDCIMMRYPDPVVKYKLKDWLKSLRPQPKQEWSEEDEKMFESLHTCVCRCINDDRFDYAEREQISRVLIPFIERLKSLRPNHYWKPSEEQMGALNYAYCELFKRGDVRHNILGPLQNLIDTLRKL